MTSRMFWLPLLLGEKMNFKIPEEPDTIFKYKDNFNNNYNTKDI